MLSYTYINNNMKENIIFIHGLGVGCEIFTEQTHFFSKHYNLILIDLNGHGQSKDNPLHLIENKSFTTIARSILSIMDNLEIYKCHFIGLSLGTIIINYVADLAPNRVKSMTLLGNATRYPKISSLLIPLTWFLRHILHYKLIYIFLWFFIIPKNQLYYCINLYIHHLSKLGQKEFFSWFSLLKDFKEENLFQSTNIPKIYIMGEHDPFLLPTREIVETDELASLIVVNKAYHLVNLTNSSLVNNFILQFLKINSYS